MPVYEAKQPSVRILEKDLGNLSSVPSSCSKFSQYHQDACYGVILIFWPLEIYVSMFGERTVLSVVNVISFPAGAKTKFHISNSLLNGKVTLTWS